MTGPPSLDGKALSHAAEVTPPPHGELEITTLLGSYLNDDFLQVCLMGRGCAWQDIGTHAKLLDADNFVRKPNELRGLETGSSDETTFAKCWISKPELTQRVAFIARMHSATTLRIHWHDDHLL